MSDDVDFNDGETDEEEDSLPCEKRSRSKLYKLVMMFDYNVEQNIIGLMMTMRPSEKGRTSKLYIGAKLLLAVGAGSW